MKLAKILVTIAVTALAGFASAGEVKPFSQAEFDKLQSSVEGSALIERVQKMIARNEYKRRQAPPILRVRARAFGSGRQLPIAAKHY